MSMTRRDFVQTSMASLMLPTLRSLLPGCGNEPPASSPSPEMLYDSDGLIVHRGCNGGDTAQREGWYWFGLWIRQNVLSDAVAEGPTITRRITFDEVLQLLEPHRDGVFYRHPKLPPWNNPYDKDWGFSRDQMIPLVAAMGVWGRTEPLRRLWNALPQDPVFGTKHTFNGHWVKAAGKKLFYTGDDVKFATINLFRRAWNENPMKASDGNGKHGEEELAGNVGIRLAVASGDRDNTGDDLNLIVMLLMSVLRFPSETSNAAVNIYAKNRPVSYGSFMDNYYAQWGFHQSDSKDLMASRIEQGISAGWKTDASRVYGAVRWYQRAESSANPKLAELYRPIIRRYLE